MMLAYPSFMQRPPFAAAVGPAAYPQGMPSYSQLSMATIPHYCSATTPPSAATLATFALHLNSPSHPATVGAQERKEMKSPLVQHTTEPTKKSPAATSNNGSKSSFSIASILARDDSKPKNAKSEVPASIAMTTHRDQQVSPVTPLSAAGQNPSSFYYFYPPHPQAPSSFPFHTGLTESELHRGGGLHGRITAPVAVISEIVRNAGELATKLSVVSDKDQITIHSCIATYMVMSGILTLFVCRSFGDCSSSSAGTQDEKEAQATHCLHRETVGRSRVKVFRKEVP